MNLEMPPSSEAEATQMDFPIPGEEGQPTAGAVGRLDESYSLLTLSADGEGFPPCAEGGLADESNRRKDDGQESLKRRGEPHLEIPSHHLRR